MRNRRPRATRAAAVLALVVFAAGCSIRLNQREPPPWEPIAEPPLEQIETVLFVMGDAGAARFGKTPIMHVLQQDIEEWAERMARDSAVVLLNLGDNIYPKGLHRKPNPNFASDSALLADQAALVGGPMARRYHTPGIFVAGNHDWAIQGGVEGEARLRAQAALLTAFRQEGANVRMLPPAGTPGPGVVDIGRKLRLILLDTAWWVLSPSRGLKSGLLIRFEEAMRSRGDRTVVVAAHHPWNSGGPHGEGMVPVWKTLGIKYFLSRSGSLLQDMRSLPLLEFRQRMSEVYGRTGAPLVFAGGHEHSLQVMGRVHRNDPHYSVVSGSMSKVTHVGWVEGQRFRADLPGYMRMFVLRDGTIALFAIALGEEFVHCEQKDPAARTQCIAEATADARVIYSAHLRATE